MQEAYRALKGRPLRIETYAEDGSANATNPYTVVEQNFALLCLQNQYGNLHAVFAVDPRETLTFHYERNTTDPRVTHDVTLEVDSYGSVKRVVSIGYPRRTGYSAPEPTVAANIQSMLAYDQTRLHLIGAENQYTNAIDDTSTYPDTYRAPISAGHQRRRATGITPTAAGHASPTCSLSPRWTRTGRPCGTRAHDIAYEAIPASDVDGAGALPTTPTRRFIEQKRQLYRTDDLTALLPPGQLQTLALPGRSYRAALTPGLLSNVFGAPVPNATLAEGGYIQLAGATGWWLPSSRIFYSPGDADTPPTELAAARAAFFVARRAVDPFGAISRVTYDGYSILPTTTTDAVGNVTTAANDYRVMAASVITRSQRQSQRRRLRCARTRRRHCRERQDHRVSSGDSLSGFVTDLDDATIAAHLANPLLNPGAMLGNATTRIIYDRAAYFPHASAPQPTPPTAYTLLRETNVSDLAAGQTTKYQHHFSYSGGFTREIQAKMQAAPGPLTTGGPSVTPRWVGSGWTIFNNKGGPIRKYEPFFSRTNAFEFAALNGVSTILFYDSTARTVATVHPDNAWDKTVFDCWRQESWDANDTVLIADPRTDTDVGNYFRAPVSAMRPARLRRGTPSGSAGTYGTSADDQAAQKDAAQNAAAHAATPSVAHFDALGRGAWRSPTTEPPDVTPVARRSICEGKPLAVFDATGARVFEIRTARRSGRRIADT